MPHYRLARREWLGASLALMLLGALASGCTDNGEKSRNKAVEHVEFLVPVTTQDVSEIRSGLPEGAKYVGQFWSKEDPVKDPQQARVILERARNKVQDLRVAKSTFFALATPDGSVVRNNLDPDLMVGKSIFDAFPELRASVQGGFKETLGAMTEADGVRGKPDAQWVASHSVSVDSKVVGLYITGWAWSSYARRLEAALSSEIADTEEGKKPLVYVFMIVGDRVIGTPPSPLVNAEEVAKAAPWSAIKEGVFSTKLQITGRDFGLAVKSTPEFGERVALAVLRSET